MLIKAMIWIGITLVTLGVMAIAWLLLLNLRDELRIRQLDRMHAKMTKRHRLRQRR